MTEREFAISVVRRLREAGHEALWAGGCVRDELLGLVPGDYDVATDARPEQVSGLFRRTVAVGVSFGVVNVLGPRSEGETLQVEVATFRSDAGYSDGRHPDSVRFTSAREDALRRDFTINGMFFDPLENRLIDYVGGQADLEQKILRAIGDPAVRFAEDKLRMLRAVRIATRFDFAIEPATAAAIAAMARQILVVSAERIAEELRNLLLSPHRARGVNLLLELGLARAILPELLPMKGLPQGPPHEPNGDLWDHVLRVLELLGPSVSFPLALAALLHDVGKPRTVGRTPDRYTFYSHEHVGRRLAEEIADRLKLSNAERERIGWLVEKHQFLCEARQMRVSKLKQTLAHPGIRDLLALHRADARASGRSTDQVEYCEHLLSRWTQADLDPIPVLTGHDLTELGLQPGPNFKPLLEAVREAQLEGTVKTKAQGLQLIQDLLKREEFRSAP
ncbi:MAG TPA: CCA tRNA nucleotidyltransferase [Gemmataceae bacterium]|nr:CCA tRNA nucleotidyltransferase [Gemmataceae bacterium]